MGFEIANELSDVVQIKVVGVGGGGGNAINRMVEAGVKGVEFVAINTDASALLLSKADSKLQIGEKATSGQGAGARPQVGQAAAEENRDEIAALLKGTDMVFITAGMGGGTGTGAAPIVAEIAQELGILTVGIVTKPFAFEGKIRMKQAEEGIKALSDNVDSIIVIPNERLKFVSEEKITLKNAFIIADDVLRQGVQSVSELIKIPQMVNLDFADVTAIIKDSGYAHMGVGYATGRDKAEVAAKAAITSPLIETDMKGAKGVIINITGSVDIGLEEVETASSIVADTAHEDANIIWGVSLDESMDDAIKITVIATGFAGGKKKSGEVASAAELIDSFTEKEEDTDYVDLMSAFNR